jgi:hypothetical protein
MAGPIALAAALSRTVPIRCPWCGYRKLVARKAAEPVAYRVCPKCKKHFPDPLAKPRTRR